MDNVISSPATAFELGTRIYELIKPEPDAKTSRLDDTDYHNLRQNLFKVLAAEYRDNLSFDDLRDKLRPLARRNNNAARAYDLLKEFREGKFASLARRPAELGPALRAATEQMGHAMHALISPALRDVTVFITSENAPGENTYPETHGRPENVSALSKSQRARYYIFLTFGHDVAVSYKVAIQTLGHAQHDMIGYSYPVSLGRATYYFSKALTKFDKLQALRVVAGSPERPESFAKLEANTGVAIEKVYDFAGQHYPALAPYLHLMMRREQLSHVPARYAP